MSRRSAKPAVRTSVENETLTESASSSNRRSVSGSFSTAMTSVPQAAARTSANTAVVETRWSSRSAAPINGIRATKAMSQRCVCTRSLAAR